MFRCALLLSFITTRSVVGQPGVRPSRVAVVPGSSAVWISTARQRWSDVVGLSCQRCGGETTAASEAPNGTVSSALVPGPARQSWYGLPVPNSENRKRAVTEVAGPLPPTSSRDTRAKAKLSPLVVSQGVSFTGRSLASKGFGVVVPRWFHTSELT